MNNKIKTIQRWEHMSSGLTVYTLTDSNDKYVCTSQLAAMLGYKSHNDMSRKYITFYASKFTKTKYKLMRTDDVFKLLATCRNTKMAQMLANELVEFLSNDSKKNAVEIAKISNPKEDKWKDDFIDKVKEILSRKYYNKSTYITCLENLIKHSKKI